MDPRQSVNDRPREKSTRASNMEEALPPDLATLKNADLFKMKPSTFERRAEKTLAKAGLTINPSNLIDTDSNEFNKIVENMSPDQKKVAAELRRKGKNVKHAIAARERKRLELQHLQV